MLLVILLVAKIRNTKVKQSTKKAILVIDDEFGIVNTIELWLQRHGFKAFGFTDPSASV